ncbi:MAG TPA: hypothetical protein VMJ10_22545 [Kofleriaceae bacterium]|nr:hypothetical protein [Kofleriaceae bacterium]
MSKWMCVSVVVAACTSSSSSPQVATGELGAWLAAPPLPVARANHCSVAIDNWVLAIGGNRSDGNGGFVNTDEIDAAQVAADGTLGAWQVAGHLPSPGSQSTCTSDGHTLYVIDGIFDDASKGSQVWSGDFSVGGTFESPLVSLGALPNDTYAISEAATVIDGTLLVTTSNTSDDTNEPDQTFTIETPIGGGAPLAWSIDAWQGVDFRAASQLAFSTTTAYVLGGYHDPAAGAITDTFDAPIGAAGALGTAVATTELPAPVAFGRAAVIDDWMFVVGGRPQVYTGGGSTTVYSAPIAHDGSLGAWTMPTALSAPRTNFALALVGEYLVLTGGGNDGPGDTMVLVAQARGLAAKPD